MSAGLGEKSSIKKIKNPFGAKDPIVGAGPFRLCGSNVSLPFKAGREGARQRGKQPHLPEGADVPSTCALKNGNKPVKVNEGSDQMRLSFTLVL